MRVSLARTVLIAPALLVLVHPVAHADTLTPAEKAAGWKTLFDGTSTSAWRGYKQKDFPASGWVIEDGCLKVQAGHGGESGQGGDIVTKDQYGDFELSLEWKTGPAANSGIMFRVGETLDASWQTGPEIQILDDAGHREPADGTHSAGALYDLIGPATGKSLKPAGEFNHSRIRLRDHHLEHWLNGVKVIDVDLDNSEWTDRIAASKFKDYADFGILSKGHIALQDHGDDVWFRNIRVRDLQAPMPGEKKLFDGGTFNGWTHHLEPDGPLDGTWSIKDGIIICKGEPAGYIRTVDDYTNFVLKLQWRFDPVTKKAGNSGVLFRMQEPDVVWPRSIEAQLFSENAGDFWCIGDFPMKTDPARTNGRNTKKLAMAERPIGQWNEYEIVCDGPTVAVYVNGVLCNQATDVAEWPGKICLQSEGAEIHFQNIRLAPIPGK